MVFDDGDDRYVRKASAGKLGQGNAYADVLEGEKGDPTIPYNEYFRVRTRTGHQLLLHNSEDLIYIGNAKGTSWIELTSNGKIDIYAEDSISIHSQNDINLRADRDVNIEGGRNVNIKATGEYKSSTALYSEPTPGDIFDDAGFERGRVQIESMYNTNILIGNSGKIHVRNDDDVEGNFDFKVMGNMRISVQDKDTEPTHTNISEETIIADQPEETKGLHIFSFENTRINSQKNVDVVTLENLKISTIGNFDLKTTGNNAFTAGGATDIKSGGNHTETAPQIHMNGPAAATAAAAEQAEIADAILKLVTWDNPVTDPVKVTWEGKKRYLSEIPVKSIMRRVPMHEPWPLHENFLPDQLTPDKTDREG
jgi:hypothetical protein